MKLTKVITSSAFALSLSLSGLAVAAESGSAPLTTSTGVSAHGEAAGCGSAGCGAGSCGAEDKDKKNKKNKKDKKVELDVLGTP